MHLSTEIIVGIIAVFVALPPMMLALGQAYRTRHKVEQLPLHEARIPTSGRANSCTQISCRESPLLSSGNFRSNSSSSSSKRNSACISSPIPTASRPPSDEHSALRKLLSSTNETSSYLAMLRVRYRGVLGTMRHKVCIRLRWKESSGVSDRREGKFDHESRFFHDCWFLFIDAGRAMSYEKMMRRPM